MCVLSPLCILYVYIYTYIYPHHIPIIVGEATLLGIQHLPISRYAVAGKLPSSGPSSPLKQPGRDAHGCVLVALPPLLHELLTVVVS